MEATPSGRPTRRALPSASTRTETESDAGTAPTRPRSLEASPASTKVSGPTAISCPARVTSPGKPPTPRPTVSIWDRNNISFVAFPCFGSGSLLLFLVGWGFFAFCHSKLWTELCYPSVENFDDLEQMKYYIDSFFCVLNQGCLSVGLRFKLD